ncbi:Hsp20/alpha crystallin family protein [Candidatus Pacearchaeota archaeon]|nr:Hsp20/alpha crystallin family protein [Candidatus Pacearchaeota archaeon]
MSDEERSKHEYLRQKAQEFLDRNRTEGLFSKTSKKSELAFIDENENEFVITLKLPLVSKEDIHLTLGSQGVLITAERNVLGEDDYDDEKRFVEFSQYVSLPEGIDRKGIKAKYLIGTLVLFVPKLNSNASTN